MVERPGRVEGKVAIVTGAGSTPGPGVGTGKASAILLAREGAKVLLVDVHPERAEETQKIIAEEDERNPHSDQKIVEILAQDGVVIARRTVAKYREMLGILSSSKRKKYF